MAIDLANTLELQRDGTTADLLDDRDGLARWLRGSGGPEEVSASQLQELPGACARAPRRRGPAAHPPAGGGGSGQSRRLRRSRGRPAGGRLVGGPGRDPAAALRSARLRPMVRRVPAAAALVLTYLRQPSPSRRFQERRRAA
jgi:hypothetical protein